MSAAGPEFAAIRKLDLTELSLCPPYCRPVDQFRFKMPDLTFRFDRPLFN
jgi:hypothetical protein